MSARYAIWVQYEPEAAWFEIEPPARYGKQEPPWTEAQASSHVTEMRRNGFKAKYLPLGVKP